MKESSPLVEVVPPLTLSKFLKHAFVLLVLIFVLICIFVPKSIVLETSPPGATVFHNDNKICDKTPCEIKLNRIGAKRLILEQAYHFPRYVDLFYFGIGWDKIEDKPIVFDTVLIDAHRQEALEFCRNERADLANIHDIEVMPCYRVPPVMPSRAERSGHCHVVFDVQETGKTSNVRLNGCTESVFEEASIQAVKVWEYLPAIQSGEAISVSDVKTQITFKLTDEQNNLIPELPNFIENVSHTGHDYEKPEEPENEE